MKLCHVVPSLEEQHGGPSKSVRALCAALAGEDNDVELFATQPGLEAPVRKTAGNLRLTFFKRDAPQRVCPSAGLRDALRQTDSEIVHHHSIWLRTLHYVKFAARRRHVPLVVSPRGMMSDWAWQHHRARKLFSRCFVHPGAFSAVTGWHATSAAEEQEIRARGFEQPICVAPNGVELPSEADTVAARSHWLEACPTARDRKVALFYSRFHRKKRIRELIEIWSKCAPADWLLLLVGVPEEYTPDELREYAREVGVGERVASFSGLGRPPPFAIASLFLLPSHNENFGLVVAEAMANRVPALVTDTTPWHELPRRNIGWCTPWSEYEQTLRVALAESPDALRDRGERARAWVQREFSWERSARELLRFYSMLKEQHADA